MNVVERALNKAAVLHDGQYRKKEKVPYIVHPVAVAMMLFEYTDDEQVIAAALLHDTVEDCGYAPDDLEREFGKRIKNLVLGVTEDKSLPWRERKERYLKHLRTAPSESVLIAAADKIHNIRCVVELNQKHGDETWGVFDGASGGNYLWYWKELLKIVKERGIEKKLVEQFEKALNEMQSLLHKLQTVPNDAPNFY